MTTSVVKSRTSQSRESYPQTTHGQMVASLEECLTPLQRCNWHILQLQPTEQLVKMLLFPKTHSCERKISRITNMMTKWRSGLILQKELCVLLAEISPRINNLCQARQAHPSHQISLLRTNIGYDFHEIFWINTIFIYMEVDKVSILFI